MKNEVHDRLVWDVTASKRVMVIKLSNIVDDALVIPGDALFLFNHNLDLLDNCEG